MARSKKKTGKKGGTGGGGGGGGGRGSNKGKGKGGGGNTVCRYLPLGFYSLIPCVLTTMALLTALVQDGCDFARVEGDRVEEISGSDVLPFLEVGLTHYRVPLYYPSKGRWMTVYTEQCKDYPRGSGRGRGGRDDGRSLKDDIHVRAARWFVFFSAVIGGGLALFVWFSVCFVFTVRTWRFCATEAFLAGVLRSGSFLFWGSDVCTSDDADVNTTSCVLHFGSCMDLAGIFLWLLTSLVMFAHYPEIRLRRMTDEEKVKVLEEVESEIERDELLAEARRRTSASRSSDVAADLAEWKQEQLAYNESFPRNVMMMQTSTSTRTPTTTGGGDHDDTDGIIDTFVNDNGTMMDADIDGGRGGGDYYTDDGATLTMNDDYYLPEQRATSHTKQSEQDQTYYTSVGGGSGSLRDDTFHSPDHNISSSGEQFQDEPSIYQGTIVSQGNDPQRANFHQSLSSNLQQQPQQQQYEVDDTGTYYNPDQQPRGSFYSRASNANPNDTGTYYNPDPRSSFYSRVSNADPNDTGTYYNPDPRASFYSRASNADPNESRTYYYPDQQQRGSVYSRASNANPNDAGTYYHPDQQQRASFYSRASAANQNENANGGPGGGGGGGELPAFGGSFT